MKSNYVPPAVNLAAFSCPFCNSFAHQEWFALRASRLQKLPRLLLAQKELKRSQIKAMGFDEASEEYQELVADRLAFSRIEIPTPTESVANLHLSRCVHCKGISVWVHDRMVGPLGTVGPAPNPDLSAEIRKDFEEARNIAQLSPRGAAALLRLAIQKLCAELGESGKNINSDISNLVKKGLDPRIQKALDIVRVIGNEAVHPGTMNIDDDFETVSKLFSLVNLITERMITHPKSIDELYSQLPEDKIAAIEKRDGK